MKLYNDIYKEIEEITGTDTMIKLYKRFRGQQISFPTKLFDPKLISEVIMEEYNGSNIQELAKKYCYTEKTIRRMLKNGQLTNDNGDDII